MTESDINFVDIKHFVDTLRCAKESANLRFPGPLLQSCLFSIKYIEIEENYRLSETHLLKTDVFLYLFRQNWKMERKEQVKARIYNDGSEFIYY